MSGRKDTQEETEQAGATMSPGPGMKKEVLICRNEEWNRNFSEVIYEAAHILSGSRDRRMLSFRTA